MPNFDNSNLNFLYSDTTGFDIKRHKYFPDKIQYVENKGMILKILIFLNLLLF